ncbi:MAG: metallophosphoesterase family protein [Planctomycetota bacterium]|jgi:hypothetical protein
MRRVVLLFFFAIASIHCPTKHARAAGDYVAPGSVWKVWDREEAPPSGWQEAEFDDSAWQSLKAPFAMNVPAEAASQQGLSLVEMRPTTYYRIAFDADRQGNEVVELALMVWLRKTAGLAAHLNGAPIDVRRLPQGYSHHTLSEKHPIFTRYDMTKRGIDPDLIRDGRNVLAIEIHLTDPKLRLVSGIDVRLRALRVNDNRLVAGPIVSGTYADRAVLTFESLFPSVAELTCGEADLSKNRTMRRAKPATLFRLEVTNLAPDMVYSYDLKLTRAGGAAEESRRQSGRFRTSPARARDFTFGVFGDTRGYPPLTWTNMAEAMVSDDQLEFLIGLGDYVDHGDIYEEWEMQLFRPAKDLFSRVPFWTAIGNHDDLADYYYAMFPCAGTRDTGWYTFVYGHARFIVIDNFNKACDPRSEIHKAIVKAIVEAKEKYLFVLCHYPLFASGYHGEGDPKTGKPSGRGRLALWDNLMPVFEKHKVTAYMAAHTHAYERSEKDGVAYIVSGGGGAGLYRLTPGIYHPFSKAAVRAYQYLRINVAEERAILESICVARGDSVDHPARIPDVNETGKVLDRCELPPRR